MPGGRMIERIASIAVEVSDGPASRDWYVDKLGFEVVDDEGHWITVRPAGSDAIIHLCEQGEAPEGGLTGIALDVDDLQATYDELVAKGVKFTGPPEDRGWGTNTRLVDPDGNEIWLM